MSNDVSERRTSSSVRDTIIAALDSLESENEQLRDINSKVQDELSALERENQRLRNEIHQMKSDRHSFKHRIQEMEATQDELQQELQNNIDVARKLQFTGTPAFIVGDQTAVGAVGYDGLKEMIAQARNSE